MRLFRWHKTLLVAEDERDARKLLLDRYDASEIREFPIKQVRRSVKLSTDGGDSARLYTPTDAVASSGRGIIPEV